MLACGGRSWHEVAFEYPAEAKGMNAFVDQAAEGVQNSQDEACGAAATKTDESTQNKAASAGEH
jgi:hypothetical protein